MQKYKILFLAANPKNTSPLRIGEELRDIKQSIKLSPKGRELLQLISLSATRVEDLRRALLEHQPNIVHFSGHGADVQGLILEDREGNATFIKGSVLSHLFSLCPSVRCVLLNACYSKSQASEICQWVKYTIGVSQSIDDSVSIKFSEGFYDALSNGRSIPEAYEWGMSTISEEPIYIRQDLEPSLETTEKYISEAKKIILIINNIREYSECKWNEVSENHENDIPQKLKSPENINASSNSDVIIGNIENNQEGAVIGKNIIQIGKVIFPLYAFLAIGLIALFVVFLKGVKERQPKKMNGAFNIAVVEFQEKRSDGNEIIESSYGHNLSQKLEQLIFQSLNQDKSLVGRFETQYIRSEYIKNKKESDRSHSLQELATKIGADVIIHGFFDLNEQPYTFSPQFYINDSYVGGEEIVGENAFGRPIEVFLPLETNELRIIDALEPRMNALIRFTIGLAYFQIDSLEKALSHFESADSEAGWRDDQGKEVIYLFQGSTLSELGKNRQEEFNIEQSLGNNGNAEQAYLESRNFYDEARIAYEEALALTNNHYARAYIGLGKIFYDQGSVGKTIDPQLIDLSIEKYKKALNSKLKSDKAHVNFKIYWNLGLALSTKSRFFESDCPNLEALETLSKVVDYYEKQYAVELVQKLASRASYQRGLIYKECADRLSGKLHKKSKELYILAIEEFQRSVDFFSPRIIEKIGLIPVFNKSQSYVAEFPWQQVRWLAKSELAYTYLQLAEIGNEYTYQDSISIYQEILATHSRGIKIDINIIAQVYFNLGIAFEKEGDEASAAKAYKSLINIDYETIGNSGESENTLTNLQSNAKQRLANL